MSICIHTNTHTCICRYVQCVFAYIFHICVFVYAILGRYIFVPLGFFKYLQCYLSLSLFFLLCVCVGFYYVYYIYHIQRKFSSCIFHWKYIQLEKFLKPLCHMTLLYHQLTYGHRSQHPITQISSTYCYSIPNSQQVQCQCVLINFFFNYSNELTIYPQLDIYQAPILVY